MALNFGEQLHFLLSSIKDIQGTIRAVDTKVAILLAALAIPLPQVGLFFTFWHSARYAASAPHIIMALAVAFYVVAVYLAVKTLVGIGDATGHIRGVRMQNAFYAGGMFALDWRDLLANRAGTISSKSMDEYIAMLPATQEAMVEELATETMALAYIRDIKLYRQRWAFMATVAAGAAAVVGLIV